jgi:hypothetical protein
MKTFESVLAFGDSHVAGCELSDISLLDQYLAGKITLEEADAPGKELAFPKIVADFLNVPCYNYSITGGSNDRSIRKLIEAVQLHPNSLVLFGYTCSDRKEFYYPDEGLFLGRDNDGFIQTGFQWEGEISKLPSKISHPINHLFVRHFLRPNNNLKQISFIVDSICKKNSSYFLHLPLFPEKLDSVENLFGFEGKGNYLDWCEHNNFAKGPYLHYGIEAHQKLSELILKEIA